MSPQIAQLALGVLGALIFMAVYRKPSHDKTQLGPLDRFLDDQFFTRNSFFQILFAVVTYGGYGVFFVQGYDWLDADSIHRPLSVQLLPICVGTFIGACNSSPLLLKKDSRTLVDIAEFDLVTCFPGHCDTCDVAHQPRSKHCHMCHQCVQRFDHHCVFLNVCVGAGNTHWFLAFGIVHWVQCVYGSYVLYSVFDIIQKEHGLFEFIDPSTGARATFFQKQQWIASNFTIMWFLQLLLTMLGVAVLFFLIYHIERVIFNITTNEDVKRNKLQHAIKHNKPLKLSTNSFTVSASYKDLLNGQTTPPSLNKQDVLQDTNTPSSVTLPPPNEWPPQFFAAALKHNIYSKRSLFANFKDALFFPIIKK